MLDRFALPLLALLAMAMIALALVWPQGQGARSPSLSARPAAAPPASSAADGVRLRGQQPVSESRF
jgi:hypothetical protein